MDKSSSESLTNLINYSLNSLDPDANTLRQNFQPRHYPMNYPPQNIHPSFHGHYPHNINPFPGPSYQSVPPTAANYHGGPFPRNIGQYLPGVLGGFAANNPVSPVGSIAFFPGSGGRGSRVLAVQVCWRPSQAPTIAPPWASWAASDGLLLVCTCLSEYLCFRIKMRNLILI